MNLMKDEIVTFAAFVKRHAHARLTCEEPVVDCPVIRKRMAF